MKRLLFILFVLPIAALANDNLLPSKIKEVTVYLSGAQITRTAECNLDAGTTEIILTGLSTKIDESSIQVSGLGAVSIVSIAFGIDYMSATADASAPNLLKNRLTLLETDIALLKNQISGLEEEQQVFYANRAVSGRTQDLDLSTVKEISTYYRERITAIKNAIFKANLQINLLNDEVRAVQNQMAELNNAPQKEEGQIKIKFDAPVAANLSLVVSYHVHDAGWIPNYELRSDALDAPIKLTYKAHVYQKTGNDWNNVNLILSTANPNYNIEKPELGTKYINFTNGLKGFTQNNTKKHRYVYNPSVKNITGTVVDESGNPLPGANIVVKGTTNGTQSDFDGHFSLEVQQGQELMVSYIGFQSAEIPIYSSIMNIRLDEDHAALEEVVVVGYGKRMQQDITGAVSVVNPEQALQGKAAGVQIRGVGSLSNRENMPIERPKPLYIVDGVPMYDFEEGDLDMDQIESVEELRGANATAVYGNRGENGVLVIVTKKSTVSEDMTNTRFTIKKNYSIASDGDITAIPINAFNLNAKYEYFAAPIINENVYLTAAFSKWESYNLLPGEASIYFNGTFAGKTTIEPYTTKKDMTISLGINPNITVSRKQDKNFKGKSFTGSNRVLDRSYALEVKNNKAVAIPLKLVDRIPISQNAEIKVGNIVTENGVYDEKKGLITYSYTLEPKSSRTERFSYEVRYPRYKSISL